MTENSHHQRAGLRREKVTRRAFILWIAAYAAALVVVAALHSFGGAPAGVTVDQNGIRMQQARATGGPQSSLADHILPEVATLKVDG